jgi:uridine kinase
LTRPPGTIGDRAATLDRLAAWIGGVDLPHPVRVAIDGADAAGKTTLADELADRLTRAGREVIRASADNFGRPRAERYRRGRDSPDGYRLDAFDQDALARRLLVPLGPGGHRQYRAAAFDLEADEPVEPAAVTAGPDAILLADGVFLLRPAVRDLWDLRIVVRVTPETSIERAMVRDVPLLGTLAEVEARYRHRYLPAQASYLELDAPLDHADAVMDNDDPEHPRLRLRPADGHWDRPDGPD